MKTVISLIPPKIMKTAHPQHGSTQFPPAGYLFSAVARLVAQFFNLPYRRIIFGRMLDRSQALARCDATQITNLRYGPARQSRNQNGPRLWSKTQPQRVAPGNTGVLRLVLRTQPRSVRFVRLATIPGDTDRVQLCATLNAYPTGRLRHPFSKCPPGRELLLVVVGLLALMFSPPNSGAASQGTGGEPASRFIIGISPFLDKSVKDEVYRGIIRLVVEDLPLNSALAIYDAYELKTITQLSLPDARAFNSPKTRANQFAPAIRDLKFFLAQEPHRRTNSHSSFAAAIRLPQFLDFLAGTTTTTSNVSVLLIGSPLYQDAKEPAFSMVDGYFPSDGHLQASREKSVYGFSGDSTVAPPLILHWIYFGDPWVNDLHKEKITRFWTLYLERRGAQLAAFIGDLPIALQSFRQPGTTRATQHWTIDTAQRKIEMWRVSRGVTMTDWLTRDTLPASGQTPPSTMIGPMKIGIRWKERIDLDLYATPRPGAETLFFEHVRSPEGYYNKDHRSSPGREYEFIEFESSVDVREVEAYINFYKGSCPGGARGEVRIEFDGRIYGLPFFIPADQGNLGRSGASQQEYWTPIPIQKALRIVQTPIATRRAD